MDLNQLRNDLEHKGLVILELSLRLAIAAALGSAALLSGCNDKSNTPISGVRSMDIVPCYTSIDSVNFNSRNDISLFIEKAIPIDSTPVCAKRVLIGRKMRAKGFADYDKTVALYGEVSSIKYWRIWNIINFGYNSRGITLTYKSGKLVKRVLI